MHHIIVAENLSKTYGATKALDNINLTIDRNGVHLLLGPNGSGKSTFIKLCLGLIKPTRGFIEVLGLNPWSKRYMVSKEVSYAIEGANMPWWFSGRSYAQIFSKLKGIEWRSVHEIASYLGVTSYWNRPIYTYSSGMRKKLLLSLGLIEGFQLYLLDEPFTLIDDPTKAKVLELIGRLSREAAIIIATHVLLERLSDITESIAILSNGEIKVSVNRNRISSNIPLKITIKISTLNELNNVLQVLEAYGINNIELDMENKVISLIMPLRDWERLRKHETLSSLTYKVSIDVEGLYASTI